MRGSTGKLLMVNFSTTAGSCSTAESAAAVAALELVSSDTRTLAADDAGDVKSVAVVFWYVTSCACVLLAVNGTERFSRETSRTCGSNCTRLRGGSVPVACDVTLTFDRESLKLSPYCSMCARLEYRPLLSTSWYVDERCVCDASSDVIRMLVPADEKWLPKGLSISRRCANLESLAIENV